ncbi:SMC-Scp complex subunit ScpB [Ectothiorhodospira variabilis]|uniref:SMC-Scp complex subunit ScpB n=1 Tax=Ectothiorhodospira variabilis TaxID=505694 RepID=UPI001EFAECCD|nr:SMC-Scp complex subunit ScpB [Ectothiorhodospira variabilis]MCG5495146.1 SMC-Scp complex subunit ScpB [Ectothiorhodospira variabilis]MCG5503840.1 SMC-Scp complex subunit ScpB [Ectothiorhodospira variabilis]MCG5507029.1 SMC-Scp complex subunit ScpB [Ectothiorhodospira variabilis]
MTPERLQRILEGALMAAQRPLSVEELERLFEGDASRPERASIREALREIAESCQERGYHLKEVGSGYRFQVDEELAPWVSRLWEEKPPRYSRALLETLALIAYRQPITRAEIEEVRGVAVSSHIIRTLTEREWIRVVGHKELPGRPALFGTTRGFLDYFNLKSLDELPTLAELRDLDQPAGE